MELNWKGLVGGGINGGVFHTRPKSHSLADAVLVVEQVTKQEIGVENDKHEVRCGNRKTKIGR